MLLGVQLYALFRVIIISCEGNVFSADFIKTTGEDNTKSAEET